MRQLHVPALSLRGYRVFECASRTPRRVRRSVHLAAAPRRLSLSLIDACNDVRDFFRPRLREAFESQRTHVSHNIEDYILNLLCDNAFSDQASAIERPMVGLLDDAQEAVGWERAQRFRGLGDAALMVLGFFSELIPRRGIDDGYVRAMGGTGYATASNLIRIHRGGAESGLPDVLQELSERFADVAAVVADVRDQTALTEREVVAIYDRWTRTRSPRLARRLIRAGVFPQIASKRAAN